MQRVCCLEVIAVVVLMAALGAAATGQGSMLELHTRSQNEADGADEPKIVSTTVTWDPRKTAVVIVDMWDDHWCRGAAERVAELAPRVNQFVAEARRRGVLIVHCPSTCMEFYGDSPARRRAIEAPLAKSPVQLATEQRWGTAWDYPDEPREPSMPIDDSDMGCDCVQKCTIADAWTRQIDLIAIDDARDAVTDNGQELYNLLADRGVDNVMICGVHLNMCVLGRPFGIRQLVKMQKNVVLVRDLTDTMYDHRMRPFVSHFAGTDLVVAHVERYWCPSVASTDILGGTPFRFAAKASSSAQAP